MTTDEAISSNKP